MTAWQPIETAPKDGNVILISDGTFVTLAVWSFEQRRDITKVVKGFGPWREETETITETDKYGFFSVYLAPADKGLRHKAHLNLEGASHWMPLPPPPAGPHSAETG